MAAVSGTTFQDPEHTLDFIHCERPGIGVLIANRNIPGITSDTTTRLG
jgi:hypothetical protein